MAKSKSRNIVITNHSIQETWTWIFGKSQIIIESPQGKDGKKKKYFIPLENNNERNQSPVTPKMIANYIYNNILKIPSPVAMNKVEKKEIVKDTVKVPEYVYSVFRKSTTFNEDAWMNIDEIKLLKLYKDPSDAKKEVARLTKELETNVEPEEDDDDSSFKTTVTYYSCIHVLE